MIPPSPLTSPDAAPPPSCAADLPAQPAAHAACVAHVLTLRLHPGDELLASLQELVRAQRLEAGAIVSAVGSLQAARLRYAGAAEATELAGPLEIVALSGTLGPQGVHVHLAVADPQGHCRGGHLLTGCTVRTTLELVIAVLADLRFERRQDPVTGYRELWITRTGDPT